MKLKRIFIQGFKSFAAPTELEISNGITAIVGPNGSGKSNVLDAIKWLFGEQSLKNLRADEKYDLIFSGSESSPPSRRAFVELVFLKEDGEEIRIARELTREGKNTFYINGKGSRLKDIRALFAGTGVGKDFYSVIAQGQVERIVSSSSKELRNLFEEAAGTAFYREKKKETMQKLNEVEANLTALTNVMYEKEKLMKSLYLKAKRAERYLEYTERLKEVKKMFYGNLIIREQERKEEIREELESSREKLRSLRKAMVEVESSWTALRTEMEEMDRRLSSFTKMLEDYETRKKQLLDLKNVYHRRISEIEAQYIEAATRISSEKEELDRLRKREEELLVILKSLSSEIEEVEGRVKDLEAEKEKISADFSEKEKRAVEIREEMTKMEKEILKNETEISRLKDNIEDFESKLDFIEDQLEEKMQRLSDIEKEMEEIMQSLEAATQKEKELLNELEVLKEKKEEVRTEREGILSDVHGLLRRKSELQGEINSLERLLEEYVGFSKAVRAVFKNKELFDGLYDVVANIIEMEEGTESAIGALLGGAMQNIVVRDADVAKRIIDFLKEENLGRATFLPLDLISGGVPSAGEVKNHPGFIGLASDLVRVPEGFEKLPYYLFGNDIVVRTLDDAIDIKRKYKLRSRIATLEGDVISGGGAITGGSLRKGEDPILGRKTRLKALKEELKVIDETVKELESRLEILDSQLKDLRKHEEELTLLISEVSVRTSTAKRVLEELVKTAKSLEKEIENLEKLKVDYGNKISGMKARMERLAEAIEEKRKRLAELEREIEKYSEEMEVKRKELESVSSKLVEESMKLSELNQRKESYRRELDELRSRTEEIERNVAELSEKAKILRRQSDEVKKELKETERELSAVSKELEELFGSMNLHHEDKAKMIKQLKEVEEELSRLKEEREGLVERIHNLEMALQEVSTRVSRYLEEVPEGYEDVERLSDEEMKEVEGEMKELLGKIKGIGSVDLDAIEEYKVVETEYNDLDEQKRDLEEAKRKLMEIMERTEEEARRRFLEVFNRVNENFSRYITELFFGGEGRIRMVSEEDVFDSELEIVVKKPGRRVQKLQLLSGGEKALVAIALLFSFLHVNPSPFYVLDEVDGPLDDYNAERFARFLRRFSKEAQFVVITHNKIVMEAADVLHGITMADGVSLVIPVEMLQTG